MSKDIWGQLADTYEADHVYLSGADLVSAIKARVAQAVPDGEVVELGCGTGIYTAAYAPRCSRVIATDLSQRMVDRTRPPSPRTRTCPCAWPTRSQPDSRAARQTGSWP